MSIKLVSKKERLKHEISGSIIHYRRISLEEKKLFLRKNTRRGIVDQAGLGEDMLRAAVLGWDNVLSEGEPVEFSSDLVMCLPDEVIEELVPLLDAATHEDAQASGN